MRQVGSRRERGVALSASESLLTEGARFNEAVSRLSQSTFVPKGSYRFRSHEAANRHADASPNAVWLHGVVTLVHPDGYFNVDKTGAGGR